MAHAVFATYGKLPADRHLVADVPKPETQDNTLSRPLTHT
jgi:hypothetical protein